MLISSSFILSDKTYNYYFTKKINFKIITKVFDKC